MDRQPATAAPHAAVRLFAVALTVGVLSLGMPGPAAAASIVTELPDPAPLDDMGPSDDPPLPGRRRGWPVRPTGAADVEPDPTSSGKYAVLSALDLYRSSGFRYQDPNYAACTATSAMDMLNFIALARTGGTGFRWKVDRGGATRDAILAWERTHDTLAGGQGSDPHGWRNALNLFGWGSEALGQSGRVYDDFAFTSYDRAVKAAIRAIIRTRKPVGIIAWEGRHAQMLTGYDGLVGDPFARRNDAYTNTFTVKNIRLSDPLKADARVDSRIPYSALRTTSDLRIKFQPYRATDSPYDDAYTSGVVPAREEWYGRFVVILPLR